MPELLFIAHRIPYPPDKGDKIRAWHMLRHLARSFDIHLLAFIDDEADWAHRARLEGLCESVFLAPLGAWEKTFRSLRALLTGRAITDSCYQDRSLNNHLDRLMARNLHAAIAFSSGVMPVLMAPPKRCRMIADFVDMDSEKWRVLADKSPWPMSLIFAREARLIGELEQRALAAFDASILVSRQEAELFKSLSSPTLHDRIVTVTNGVDTAYYDPDAPMTAMSHREHGARLVFTGAMDYAPNIEAVSWFAREALPKIGGTRPVLFQIVGSNPTSAVKALGKAGRIEVTGRVADTRPYLQAADLVVAPLQLARGIQNKVLEAMAMRKAVVATTTAAEGIAASDGGEFAIADTPDAMAASIVSLLDDPVRAASIGARARQYVLDHHGWEATLAPLTELLAGSR